MAETEIQVAVECPKCGAPSWPHVDALVGSGGIPQNEQRCPCGCTFIVEADITLSVYAKDPK